MKINFKRVFGIVLISTPFAVLGALSSITIGVGITIGVIVGVLIFYGIVYLGVRLLFNA